MRLTAITTILGLAAAAGGGFYAAAPGFRTAVDTRFHDWFGWTPAARQAQPAEFAGHVQERLDQDLKEMKTTRGELAAECDTLDRKLREQRMLREQAQQMAAEFRRQYQAAEAAGSFPIKIRGAEYTRDQATAQVSLLLAEAEGYQAAIKRLEDTRHKADSRLEELTVRINATEAQLVALPAQRSLLRAERLSQEGMQLVAQLDALLTDNRQLIASQPVRDVRTLLEAGENGPATPTNRAAALAFLTAPPAESPVVRGQEPDATPAELREEEHAVPKAETAIPAVEPSEPAAETAKPATLQEEPATDKEEDELVVRIQKLVIVPAPAKGDADQTMQQAAPAREDVKPKASKTPRKAKASRTAPAAATKPIFQQS